MSLFGTMSLFGSIGTLFYIVLSPFVNKSFSIQWRRGYLILNIVEYLFPFPYYFSRYKSLLKALRIWPFPERQTEPPLFLNYTDQVIQIAPYKIRIPNSAAYLLSAVLVVIGIAIVNRYLIKYKKIKGYLRQNTELVSMPVYGNAKHCRYKVYQCRYIKSPFTIGIFRPAIVLPYRAWNEEELNMVLEHEIIHIHHCDNLIKLLSFVVLAFNIYNPLAWYVMYQWNLVAELSCDRKVITGKTKEEIKQYGFLIVEIAERSAGDTKQPIMGLNIQNKMMKERIYQIKNGVGKESLFRKVIGAGVMGITVFTSSLTVFAYSPKMIMYSNSIATDMYFSEEDIMWGNTDVSLPVSECGSWVFFNDEGEVIEVAGELNHDLEVHSSCAHKYVAGKTTKHIKNSDNSCQVEYYEAEKCSKCGYIKLGELMYVITFLTCSH